MALSQYLLGIKGEDIACEYLKNKDFEILERKFSF